jgi:hypothetical protein
MNRAEFLNLWPEVRAMVDRVEHWLHRWIRIHWKRSLVFLQLLKMVYWFRDVNPFSSFPLANVDYIQFYGRVLRMHGFLERSGRIWGYDPFDMAGYLSGPFLEVGTHALALISHVLEPLLPISVTMLVIEISGLVGMPFLVFPIMRLFGANRRTAWVAFGVIVFTFGVCEPFSVSMYKIGLWGFMLSGFGSLLQIAFFYRWIEHRGMKLWAGLTVTSALLFQIHPAAVILVMAPFGALYFMNFRRLGWRGHAALGVMAAIVAATNWYWISPFLAFSHWRVTAPYYTTMGLRDILNRFGPVQGELYPAVSVTINDAAIVLALIALRQISITRPMLARVLLIWLVWLFAVAYFGSWIPWVRTLQPGRNEFVFFLLLYLLTATVLESHVLASKRPRFVAGLAVAFLLACMFDRGPGSMPWSKSIPPLRTELTGWQDNLIQYLRTKTPLEGRVLLECADDVTPNFADVVPGLTGAVLLGGQHPGNFLATRSSLFSGYYLVNSYENTSAPTAFNHSLSTMKEEDFSAYLSLYNVELVVARSGSLIDVLDRMTNTLELIDEVPPHKIYRNLEPATWFLDGDGRISFEYDKITIDDASTGILIPKVHWFDTFKSEPAVPIHPVFLMDDPVPFLSIDNSAGFRHIEIFNAGLPPFRERLRDKLAHKKPW